MYSKLKINEINNSCKCKYWQPLGGNELKCQTVGFFECDIFPGF